MTHKTKGIVLRVVKYGETSIVATIYTELLGLQSYMVKGVRKPTKYSQGKANYFQPGAMLDMIVYHNTVKSLQFIREYQWAHLYQNIFFDVVRNAISIFIIEMILHSIKEEESNPDLFYFFENTLLKVDEQPIEEVANYPISFCLQLAYHLGIQFHGDYSEATPYLDLLEGAFVAQQPPHAYYAEKEIAQITSALKDKDSINDLSNICLNRNTRRELLKYYQQFFSLHLENFGELKSYHILQMVLQ